jgi:hypothetical protein
VQQENSQRPAKNLGKLDFCHSLQPNNSEHAGYFPLLPG